MRTDLLSLIPRGGGSGCLGIQIAKHLGAVVTAVDNESKLDFMRSLGADSVVDYRRDDFAQRGEHYDLNLDLAAFRSVMAPTRVLADGGKYLMVGGSMSNLLWTLCFGRLRARRGQQIRVLAVQAKQGLDRLFEYIREGVVTSQIEHVYPLRDAREALRRVADGRALGKVIVVP